MNFWNTHINPLSAKITKWSNTLKQFVGKLSTNCLSVFDHFVRLALTRLTKNNTSSFKIKISYMMYLIFKLNLIIKKKFGRKNILKQVISLPLDTGDFCLKMWFPNTKLSLRGVPRKRCSGNIQQIYRRTPLLKPHFGMGVIL